MAQYQKSFYSTGLYGRLNAFVGSYETEIFDGQEVFTSKINCSITAELPRVLYKPNNEYMKIDGWEIVDNEAITKTAGATIEAEITGDNFEVYLRYQNKENQRIKIQLLKEAEDGSWEKVTEKAINTFSSSQSGNIMVAQMGEHGFNNYKIVMLTTELSNEASFIGFNVQTTNITMSIRTSENGKKWSEYEEVRLSQSEGVLNGTSIAYSNIRYVQGLLWLMSSDNTTNPVVDRIEIRSNNSELYEYNGDYTVEFNMEQIALREGAGFQKAYKIKWEEEVPNGTSVTVRSSSSRDGFFWGAITAPYRKDTNRIRLKPGATKESIIIGPIEEDRKFSHTKTTSYNSWNDQSFFPKDENETSIAYLFSKTSTDRKDPKNLLQYIENPPLVTDRKIEFEPQSYYLTIELSRSAFKGTPVVDFIEVNQTMVYNEAINLTDKNISAVDNKGKGEIVLDSIEQYSFSYPDSKSEIAFNKKSIDEAEQVYLLEDKTNRPNDIMIYFSSESNQSSRTNKTTNIKDEVVAKTINRKLELGEKQGLVIHNQYSAGSVAFLRPIKQEMESSFTPQLDKHIKYRYYIVNGWPDEYHIVTKNQTMEDLEGMFSCTEEEIRKINNDILFDVDDYLLAGQRIDIPNKTNTPNVSVYFETGSDYTEKSSHNAVISNEKDVSSENVVIEMLVEDGSGYVDWVSTEKVYCGVINTNDKREAFLRTQLYRYSNEDLDRDYTVQEGDTWESISVKFDVNIVDLVKLNEEVEFEVGKAIKVPANIILPEIPAEVELGEHVYDISIVQDSVYKKTGQKLDESFIPIDWEEKHFPLSIKYRSNGSDQIISEIVRGDIKNGMDALPYSMVREVISIRHKDSNKLYKPYDSKTRQGDYILKNNYISWSPVHSGSEEPNAGETYIVTYVREEVESVTVHLDTNYVEKIGADIAWRSPEIKVIEGVCTPEKDFLIELPTKESFDSFDDKYKDVNYIIQDNDIWVETSVKEQDGKSYLYATLDGKDPSVNWYPTINTGHYYLKEDEYYMYSEPIRITLTQKELPQAENVEYVSTEQGIGALLLPASNNLIRDSVLQSKENKLSFIFNGQSI